MTIFYEPELYTAGQYEPAITTPVITKSQPVITNLKTGHYYGAIMDRIKIAYISNNKRHLFLCLCVLTIGRYLLANAHFTLHLRATYNLYEQTRDGRRRTSMEQSEAKIGQIR
jgi:hypothetical protein